MAILQVENICLNRSTSVKADFILLLLLSTVYYVKLFAIKIKKEIRFLKVIKSVINDFASVSYLKRSAKMS